MRSLRGLAVLVAAAVIAAGCGTTAPPKAPSAPSGRIPTSASGGGTSPAPSPPAPATTSAMPPATTPPAASAATQLAAFFAAASRADSQLRHAAALVNGDIGATSMRFTPATIAAVNGIDLAAAASALPAGLPTGMLRDVLLVYSDLASRSGAFNGLRIYGSSGRELPAGGPDAQLVLRGLRNGAPAAAAFSGDLAAARYLARQTPRVTIAAPDSRAALELALRLQSINLHNTCSDNFGGYAPRGLEPIVWQPGGSQHSSHYEGLAGGIRFTADYTVKHAWTIIIYAC